MKKLITLLLLGSLTSTLAMAELTKEDLAQEVAHCYVGHERASSDDFKSGKSEQLKDVIGNLVGPGEVNKLVQIADRIQRNRKISIPGAYAPNKSAEKVMTKYCTDIDEKLAIVLK